MSKQSLEWHKQCVQNYRNSMERSKAALESIQYNYQKSVERLAFHEAQIQEAERRGMDGFDANRLLVKRKK